MYITSFHFPTDATQRELLLTLFALSVKYEPCDVTHAVSCGMLPLLARLCGSATTVAQMCQAPLYCLSSRDQQSNLVQVASVRLLQILAVTVG